MTMRYALVLFRWGEGVSRAKKKIMKQWTFYDLNSLTDGLEHAIVFHIFEFIYSVAVHIFLQ